MKVVVVVVIERVADHVSVLEVIDELFVVVVLAIRSPNSIQPTRIDRKRRRRLRSQLGHISPIAVHVVVADHHSGLLAHESRVTVNCFRMTSITKFISAIQIFEAKTRRVEAIVNSARNRLMFRQLFL